MNQQQQQQQPQPQQLQQQQQQHPGGGPNLGANPLVRPAGPSLVVPTPTKSSTSPSSSSSTAGVGNPMSPSTVTGTAAVGPMLSRGGMTTRARAMGGGSSFDKQSIVYMVRIFMCVRVRVCTSTCVHNFASCARVFSNESSTTASRWLCTMCVCFGDVWSLSLSVCVCVCVFCVCFKISLYDNNISFIHSFHHSFITGLVVCTIWIATHFDTSIYTTRHYTINSCFGTRNDQTCFGRCHVVHDDQWSTNPSWGFERYVCAYIYIYIYIYVPEFCLFSFIYTFIPPPQHNTHTHYTLSFVSIFLITLILSHSCCSYCSYCSCYCVFWWMCFGRSLARSLSFFLSFNSLFHSFIQCVTLSIFSFFILFHSLA